MRLGVWWKALFVTLFFCAVFAFEDFRLNVSAQGVLIMTTPYNVVSIRLR